MAGLLEEEEALSATQGMQQREGGRKGARREACWRGGAHPCTQACTGTHSTAAALRSQCGPKAAAQAACRKPRLGGPHQGPRLTRQLLPVRQLLHELALLFVVHRGQRELGRHAVQPNALALGLGLVVRFLQANGRGDRRYG